MQPEEVVKEMKIQKNKSQIYNKYFLNSLSLVKQVKQDSTQVVIPAELTVHLDELIWFFLQLSYIYSLIFVNIQMSNQKI